MCISYQKTMAVIFPAISFLGFVPDQLLMLKMQIYISVTIWTHLDHAVCLLQEEWRWCYAPRDVLRPHLKWKWCPVILNKNQGSSIGQFVLLEIKFEDLQFRSWLWPRVQIHRHIPCQVDKQENSAKSLQSLLYLSKCLEIMISISIPPQRRWTSVVHYLLQVPCPHLSCQPRLFSEKKTAASFDWGRSIKPVR